jgi:hypothetical protein
MAFGIALCLTGAVLSIEGTGANGIVTALRVTARWSFLLFWAAYVGSAIRILFGPAFETLGRRGREFGLAYAAAHLIHLGLVMWLLHISPRPPLSGEFFVFFTVAMVWTYLLAIFSFGGLSRALGSRGWHILRFTGLNYILFTFGVDFVGPTIHGIPHHGFRYIVVVYAPFAAMSVVAPLLALAALAHRRLALAYSHAGFGPAVN